MDKRSRNNPQDQGKSISNMPKGCSTLSSVTVKGGRSPIQGNLTGSARKIKDGVADWHNSIDRWNSFNKAGMAIISDIANIKLAAVFAVENASTDEVDPRESVPTLMPDELDDLCQKLTSIFTSMVKLVKKLSSLTATWKGICDLELHQNKGTWDPQPFFQTWPTWRFYESSQKLYQMYEKEIQVKEQIVENIAHTTSRELMMFYTACWLHEPYIGQDASLIVDSMLYETGHKS